MPARGKIIMTNHCNRQRLRSLVFSALDNFNQVERSKELIDILWDIHIEVNKTDRDWERVELLLECYEQRRNKYLSELQSDLEQLRQIVTRR